MENPKGPEDSSRDIAKRLLRAVVNTMLLFLLTQAFFLLAPQGGLFRILSPTEGYNILNAILLFLFMLLLFLGIRIIVDVIRIADYLSDYLTPSFPGLKTRKRVSMTKAMKELAYTLIIMFATAMAMPQLSSIPQVGHYLSMGVMALSLAMAAVLCYDAGKTFYSAMEIGVEMLVERIFKERPRKE